MSFPGNSRIFLLIEAGPAGVYTIETARTTDLWKRPGHHSNRRRNEKAFALIMVDSKPRTRTTNVVYKPVYHVLCSAPEPNHRVSHGPAW